MKKVILSTLIIGAVLATSCKKAKEEADKAVDAAAEVTEKTAEAVTDAATDATTKVVEKAEEVVDKAAESVKSTIDDITIPSFDNEKVEQHLKNYAAYAKEYIAAKGDVVGNSDLAKKGIELASKGSELLKTLDAESVKKFNGIISAIQAKMAPASN